MAHFNPLKMMGCRCRSADLPRLIASPIRRSRQYLRRIFAEVAATGTSGLEQTLNLDRGEEVLGTLVKRVEFDASRCDASLSGQVDRELPCWRSGTLW